MASDVRLPHILRGIIGLDLGLFRVLERMVAKIRAKSEHDGGIKRGQRFSTLTLEHVDELLQDGYIKFRRVFLKVLSRRGEVWRRLRRLMRDRKRHPVAVCRIHRQSE
jgi:hypothetical protein